MVYREEPCEFCTTAATETCPRCGSRVCETAHGLCGSPYCGLCAKELHDDLDEARMMIDLHRPARDQWRSSIVEDAIYEIEHAIARRRINRRFARRTRDEIQSWRAAAGIKRR